MSDATYPKASKGSKVTRVSRASETPTASAQPADDYEDAEYDEPYYDEDEELEYEYDEEEAGPGLLASPGRAVLLGISAVALLAVLGLVIWLLSSQQSSGPKVIEGATGGVPVIRGLAQTSEAQAPTKGAFAPDFIWTDNNQDVALSSFRGDKPVFLNFWGTWCPPCRAEMPAMEQFYQLHKDEIQMIGVSMAPRDEPTGVLSFVKDANYSWKFIHDGDYKIAEKYQVASVPSSYFIDRNGIIKVVQIGAMIDEKMIENNFQQVK